MNIQLDARELKEVQEIVMERLLELRQEVVHADVSTFRDGLKAREVLIRQILDRLQRATDAPTSEPH